MSKQEIIYMITTFCLTGMFLFLILGHPVL